MGALLAAALANNTVIAEAVPVLTDALPPVERDPGKIAEWERKLEKDPEERARFRVSTKSLWERRRVMLLAANAPEAGILPAFGLFRDETGMFKWDPNARDPQSAWPTLVAREEQYAANIRLAEHDTGWVGINSRVPLIDWPLLCLELAWLRNYDKAALPPTDDPTRAFIRALALELVAPNATPFGHPFPATSN
jgi:hypothetical protein